MVTVVVVMVVCDHAAIHVSSGERGTGKCDCGEGRDEFDLVHGMVPFFALGYVFRQIDAPISPPTSPLGARFARLDCFPMGRNHP